MGRFERNRVRRGGAGRGAVAADDARSDAFPDNRFVTRGNRPEGYCSTHLHGQGEGYCVAVSTSAFGRVWLNSTMSSPTGNSTSAVPLDSAQMMDGLTLDRDRTRLIPLPDRATAAFPNSPARHLGDPDRRPGMSGRRDENDHQRQG